MKAALQVFSNHATVRDYNMRMQLMEELVSLYTADSPHIAGTARACCASLEFRVKHRIAVTMRRGEHSWGRRVMMCIFTRFSGFL